MTEFHIHFTQRAAKADTGPYSHREVLSDAQCAEWRALLAAQLEAAFAALKSMPLDASLAASVSLTVKQ